MPCSLVQSQSSEQEGESLGLIPHGDPGLPAGDRAEWHLRPPQGSIENWLSIGKGFQDLGMKENMLTQNPPAF